MLNNIRNLDNAVWADYTYELRYDKVKQRVSCTCDAFTFNSPCKHIKRFIDRLKEEGIIDATVAKKLEENQRKKSPKPK